MSAAGGECAQSVLTLHTQAHGQSLRLTAKGELDLATASRLSVAIECHAAEAAALVLDLRRVSFIDSVGLGAIIAGRRACTAHGCAFSVEGSAETRRVLATYGVLGKLEFVEVAGAVRGTADGGALGRDRAAGDTVA
jgi:anti-sigma B factor antagonist